MAAVFTWDLQCNGVTKTAADWGVAEIVRHRQSQSVSTVTFNAPGRAVDAGPLFAYGATVTILQNSTSWFVGRVTRVPSDGDDRAENQSYELSDPWWYLDHLVCRQEWQALLGTVTALSTRMILGQSLTGTRITTDAVIRETLQYAIGCAAPLTIGTLDVGLLPPLDEVKDITCADVIKQMLRWQPDHVAWFDYATAPHPTLHIRKRASLAAVNLAVGAAPLSKIQGITRRDDLRPPAVVIHYEQTGNTNGQATFNIVTDAAPAGATGKEFGAVCCTIPLRGVTTNKVEQRVVTRGIRDDVQADNADDLLAYLTAHYGDLALKAADPDITAAGITITACSRGLADQNALEVDPAGGTDTDAQTGQVTPKMRQVVYDSSLANELVQGTITDWMFKQYAIRSQVHRITFTYDCDSGSGDDDGNDDNDGSAANQKYTATIDITATNAGGDGESKTTNYTAVTGYDPGDVVPTGLAAAYLNGFALVQYSGSVLLAEAEASGAANLGQVLNLTGSAQSAWSSMRAMITDETVNVDSGTTTLTFGPPEHLTPQDLVALLRVTRPGSGGGRAGTDSPGGLGTANSGARTSGAAGGTGAGASSVQLGVATPTNNACPQAGGGNLHWWNVAANGVAAYAQFDGTAPVTVLPAGAYTVNS